MGMSTYAIAIVEPDDTFDKMLAVFRACEDAGIDPPDEVEEYFGGEPPCEDGMQVQLKVSKSSDSAAAADYIDVHVDDLPEGTTTIRFVVSF